MAEPDSYLPEIVGDPADGGPLLLSCEHTTNAVPPPLKTTVSDWFWLESHWGFDIGAATIVRTLVEETSSVGVLSAVSRLVCDYNRPTENPTWIVSEVEGTPLTFNQNMDDAEKKRRETLYFNPYHDTIDQVADQRVTLNRDFLMLSIHSFTPVLGDSDRSMEVGVLFDDFDDFAGELAQSFRDAGFITALNEPYSGRDDLISSIMRHGQRIRQTYIELEIRQDILKTDEEARNVGHRIKKVLERVSLKNLNY